MFTRVLPIFDNKKKGGGRHVILIELFVRFFSTSSLCSSSLQFTPSFPDVFCQEIFGPILVNQRCSFGEILKHRSLICEKILIVCNRFQLFSIILMGVEKNSALVFWAFRGFI